MTTYATEQQTRSALLDSQRRVLERIANGAPLGEILETLVRLIEAQADGMRCAVLLVDAQKRRLRFAAAPSLPEDFKVHMIPFLGIAPAMSSCGIAVLSRRPVYTQDTQTDPLWKDMRDIALRNGMRAIWSTPILSDENAVLGTFAMYYGVPQLPSPEHIQLIDMATQMARVAIEAKGNEEKIQALSRQKEDHLRLVIDTIPTMAWSLLPDGTVDFVNQRWLEYTGLSFAEALKEAIQIVHPEDLPSVMERWLVDKAAGNPSEYEMRLRRADGEYRWFLVRTVPQRDEQGKIVKWYGTSTDIEDRKRAEDALRESEEKFRELAENVSEVFWMTTPAMDEMLYVSPAYESIWGRSLQSLRQHPRSFMEAIHPEDREHVVGTLEGQRLRGFEVEYRVVRPDGSVRWIRDRGFPVKDQSGKVYRVAGVAEDITERKHAGNALRQLAEELQALSRRLVELRESERRELARELHDRVGQSLTALNINLGILKGLVSSHDSAEAGSRLADSAALVKSTVRAIENVVSDLRPPMLEDFGLMAALQCYAKEFSLRTGLAVSVGGKEPSARIPADIEIALYRIVQEALNNVAKHARATTVAIALRRSGSEYEMSVTDDGVGFRTAGLGVQSSRPGLGMVTMRERAQAVGGCFEVMALPGNGTRLTVRVPV
ncbi:MAG TPA: PAS domain-containing protein [Burkholderiales bacterium]|jgi:PAS domain S-box-containing protein|nr:PAS domain-containing protein [Burkholderiales bacterium]